ncbi:hypothetical protein YC2023_114986 [Brassica napus]
MATLSDIGVAAAINILSALIFLLLFAILRIQPINDRVYFPKWYLKGLRSSPVTSGAFVTKVANFDFGSYIRFLNWIPAALKMPEAELIDHAGLDSAVYLRIYLIGLKIFVPIALLSWSILVPVNWTSDGLQLAQLRNVTSSDIDKLSISNVIYGSDRFWAHLVMEYAFTFWTCYVLMNEYEKIASMRLAFLQSEKRRADQFTVLVRDVPPDSHESISENVEHFFMVNHPDHYLTNQVVYNANELAGLVEEKKKMQNWFDYYQLKYTRNKEHRPRVKLGFLGLWGKKVDAMDHYTAEIEKLSEQIMAERKRVKKDENGVIPAAFVSFKTRWGAAVCAQTQQTKNPTEWLTEWAPEAREVYWPNLATPYVSLTVRRFVMHVAFFFLTFFFIIPIAFVQSLASIEGIQKSAPFLNTIIEKVSSRYCLEALSDISADDLDDHVEIRSIITGSAFEQLDSFLKQSADQIPRTVGVAIPIKATFFITYIMVDGWAGVAGEILRLKPFVIFHLKNFFLVKTEKDREEAMDPGQIDFYATEPRIQLYFLLGLVYAPVTPVLLPFIIFFFGFAYLIFRHQIINVYNQEYESAAAYWPDVHGRIISALIISQILLIGLMSTKGKAQSTPFLVILPILTIGFHRFCKGRYESAFVVNPLQESMIKDTLERAREPNLNLKGFLQNAYIHPVFKDEECEDDQYEELNEDSDDENCVVVPTKRQSRRTTASSSNPNGGSSQPLSCNQPDTGKGKPEP